MVADHTWTSPRPSEVATRCARTELSHSRRGTDMSVPGRGMKVRVLLCALEYGSQRPSQRGQAAGREQLEVRSRHPVEGDAAAHEMTPRRDPMRFGVVTHENVGR